MPSGLLPFLFCPQGPREACRRRCCRCCDRCRGCISDFSSSLAPRPGPAFFSCCSRPDLPGTGIQMTAAILLRLRADAREPSGVQGWTPERAWLPTGRRLLCWALLFLTLARTPLQFSVQPQAWPLGLEPEDKCKRYECDVEQQFASWVATMQRSM